MEYLVGTPNIANKELFQEFLDDILSSGKLTNNGKYNSKLEEAVGEFYKAEAITVCNATAGLEILLSTLPEKSYVVTPAFTFIATTSAILRAGLIPLFVDITEDFKMNLDNLERTLKDFSDTGFGISAILNVNLYGGLDVSTRINKLALQYGVKLFYDSAHSLGTFPETFGDAEIFSLHATKLINGFEGGLIVTKNKELATRVRQNRNFNYIGPCSDPEGKFVQYDMYKKLYGEYSFGTNAKLSEVHAAMALSNFYKLEYLKAHNKNIHTTYYNTINTKSNQYIVQNPGEISNYSYVVCRHKNRDSIIESLKDYGIQARKYFYHLTNEQFGYKPSIPTSEVLRQEVFCLPTGLAIDEEKVSYISNALLSCLNKEGIS